MAKAKKKKYDPLGSSFDSWLDTELKDKDFTKLFNAYRARLKLGDRMKTIAKKRGYSVRSLATTMGTSPSQIQRMFSSQATKCSLETLIKFSIVTGYDLSKLIRKETP